MYMNTPLKAHKLNQTFSISDYFSSKDIRFQKSQLHFPQKPLKVRVSVDPPTPVRSKKRVCR